LFVTERGDVPQCRSYAAPRPDFRDTDPNKQVRLR
jgi:hypothetical protein